MSPEINYLPEGCARPDAATLDRFWQSAVAARPRLAAAGACQVRWIGLDHESTEQVLALIEAGDKTGSFTLPWIVAHTTQPEPRVGDPIILIDFLGQPRLLVQLTGLEEVTFGALDERHTAVDGPPVRALAIWKPLHTRYWNGMLKPFGLQVTADMPVLVEQLDVLYGADPPVADSLT
ncbi:MAG: ASCH domain-containing protein [Gammaproteobacteria bacterium]|nr:ASCH domain-containing protein [Gammaproteobacteria bacterium]